MSMSVLHVLGNTALAQTCSPDMDISRDIDCSIDMGMQHGDGHVACTSHVCIHVHVNVHYIRFTFVSLHIIFVSLLFASIRFYSLPIIFVLLLFASICFLQFFIRIPNLLIRYEANLSESIPSIRYFA